MKKILSVLLVACLLLTAATLPASALTAADFSDVPDNWAKPAIEYCLGKGLMNGEGSGKFNPGGKVTRAQIAQVLYNKEGKPSIAGLANPFTDADGWYHDAVVWCKANGVVSGNSDTTFNPTGNVTRQDICVMVYRYAKDYKKQAVELTEEGKMESTFTDWGKVAGYAKEAVRWANKSGFMKGNSATTLNPTGQATREQLAQFIMNLDKILTVEPKKCEHGNDPDTCPICHPAEPTYEGSYNPNPDPSLYYFDVERDKNNPLACNALLSMAGRFSHVLDSYTEELSKSVIEDGVSTVTGYVLPEIEYIPGAIPGKSYKGYVPYKGYVVGGNTYYKPIGDYTYTKVWDGDMENGARIYNRFGIDVTDVDGVLSPLEVKLAKVFAQNLRSTLKYAAYPNPDAKVYFDPAMQMAAEAALEEAKENIENITEAGACSHASDSGTPATFAAKNRVDSTRAILETSKTVDIPSLTTGPGNIVVAVGDDFIRDSDFAQDVRNRDDASELDAGAFVEYFGGLQTRKRFDYYNYFLNNPKAQYGASGIFGSETIRYPVNGYKDYITMLYVCSADNNLGKFVSLNHNRHNLAFGLAYDEETSQIYAMVCSLDRQKSIDTPPYVEDIPNAFVGVLADFYTQG